MKLEEVLQLVQAVSNSNITTLKFEEGDTKILVRTGENTVTPDITRMERVEAIHMENTTDHEIEDKNVAEDKKTTGNAVLSPLVGTFYQAPSEEAEAFVKVGDKVKKGQTLAIIEAMKLMNEIESEYEGEILEILAENAQGIEYGQPLFIIG